MVKDKYTVIKTNPWSPAKAYINEINREAKEIQRPMYVNRFKGLISRLGLKPEMYGKNMMNNMDTMEQIFYCNFIDIYGKNTILNCFENKVESDLTNDLTNNILS